MPLHRPAPIRTDGSNAFARHSMRVRVPTIIAETVERNADYVPAIVDALQQLRDAMRLVKHCRQAAPEARLAIVLNRVGHERVGGVTEKRFEQTVGEKITYRLADAPNPCGEALAAGRPLVQARRGGKVAAELKRLVLDMAGTPKRRGFALRCLIGGG